MNLVFFNKSILLILFLLAFNNLTLLAQIKQKSTPPNKSKKLPPNQQQKTKDSTLDIKGEKVVVTISCFPELKENNDVLTFVEQPPEYPGGHEKMLQFIQDNLKYPADAFKQKIEGSVWLSLTIKKDGSITDIEVLKKLTESCDKEAIRIVMLMPEWVPGKQNGNVVHAKARIPIKFSLTERE